MAARRFRRTAVGLALTWVAFGAGSLAQGYQEGDAQLALRKAVAQAKAERKIVLVEFGASYCGWCRRFTQFFQAEAMKGILGTHFVVLEFAVQESNGRATPGADDLLKSWGGADAGLPFLVLVDASGAKVADSNAMPGGGNIGYPVDPDEIEAFMAMLDRAGARLRPAERDTLVSYLRTKPAKN